MEITKTASGSTASREALLVGMMRSALSARNGAVIMKMIRRTNARSRSGVTSSSARVVRLWRCRLRSRMLLDGIGNYVPEETVSAGDFELSSASLVAASSLASNPGSDPVDPLFSSSSVDVSEALRGVFGSRISQMGAFRVWRLPRPSRCDLGADALDRRSGDGRRMSFLRQSCPCGQPWPGCC